MKKKILFVLSLAFFLISLNGISSAMYSSCGDGYCDTAYDEANPSSLYFCPGDCGGRINETWCDTTYPRECPSCSSCCSPCGSTTCDTSRISNSSLNNWCTSNQYTKSGVLSTCPFPFAEKIAFFKITGNKCKDGLIIIGMIIFIVSIALGYPLFHRRKKRK